MLVLPVPLTRAVETLPDWPCDLCVLAVLHVRTSIDVRTNYTICIEKRAAPLEVVVERKGLRLVCTL